MNLVEEVIIYLFFNTKECADTDAVAVVQQPIIMLIAAMLDVEQDSDRDTLLAPLPTLLLLSELLLVLLPPELLLKLPMPKLMLPSQELLLVHQSMPATLDATPTPHITDITAITAITAITDAAELPMLELFPPDAIFINLKTL